MVVAARGRGWKEGPLVSEKVARMDWSIIGLARRESSIPLPTITEPPIEPINIVDPPTRISMSLPIVLGLDAACPSLHMSLIGALYYTTPSSDTNLLFLEETYWCRAISFLSLYYPTKIG